MDGEANSSETAKTFSTSYLKNMEPTSSSDKVQDSQSWERIEKLTKTWLEPKLPGSLEIAELLVPILGSLNSTSPLQLIRAARLLWYLQRVNLEPYIPRFKQNWIVPNERSGELITELGRYFIYAVSAYSPSSLKKLDYVPAKEFDDGVKMETVLLQIYPSVECVLSCKNTTQYLPGHMLLVNHDDKEIVLVVRGSEEVADWIINLSCTMTFVGTHRGMHRAAKALAFHVSGTLKELQHKYPTYPLVITGHSLGGGVAALVAMDWSKSAMCGDLGVRAYCYACPCVISSDEEMNDNCRIVSVVFGRDFVAHCGLDSVSAYSKIIGELVTLRKSAKREPGRLGIFRTIVGNPVQIDEQRLESWEPNCEDTDEGLQLPVHVDDLYQMAETELKGIIRQEQDWRRNMEAQKPSILEQLINSFARTGKSVWPPGFQSEQNDESTLNLNGELVADSDELSIEDPQPRCQRLLIRKSWSVIQQRWRALAQNVAPLTLPGRLIHIIPKAHFLDYQLPWPTNIAAVNSSLLVEWPKEKKLKFAAGIVCCPDAIYDHMVDRYGACLCPDLFDPLPLDFTLD
eukprot:Gregarina_sp_Poly_1__2312@NODE_1619_length_3701_cov_20_287562_g1066_i0_p1_GENE_NODE_1619_length_3701_cov_20_287562_g1066_i0NODE_1619_length_3701_cov_20_287562_g1066_i0_p1_ORF_typecomplete_len572_score79_38Lipase_3/PF01764_25/1_3e24DUF2974/PF11187_8/1_8e09Hydrolase_4/PF12146_8/0_00057DUF676/PF05057_14/0_00056DUF2048/PF09752_9/0_0018Abhydrolase_5/PF12695_7/0_0097Chlorophyllase2/PF12740_7/0_0092Esterase/PF00756_20/0_047Chlorophyllase/PF07224_11/0_045Abhydrolase_6/PF12697_7/0_085DLH/PF01738_18/0_095